MRRTVYKLSAERVFFLFVLILFYSTDLVLFLYKYSLFVVKENAALLEGSRETKQACVIIVNVAVG